MRSRHLLRRSATPSLTTTGTSGVLLQARPISTSSGILSESPHKMFSGSCSIAPTKLLGIGFTSITRWSSPESRPASAFRSQHPCLPICRQRFVPFIDRLGRTSSGIWRPHLPQEHPGDSRGQQQLAVGRQQPRPDFLLFVYDFGDGDSLGYTPAGGGVIYKHELGVLSPLTLNHLLPKLLSNFWPHRTMA